MTPSPLGCSPSSLLSSMSAFPLPFVTHQLQGERCILSLHSALFYLCPLPTGTFPWSILATPGPGASSRRWQRAGTPQRAGTSPWDEAASAQAQPRQSRSHQMVQLLFQCRRLVKPQTLRDPQGLHPQPQEGPCSTSSQITLQAPWLISSLLPDVNPPQKPQNCESRAEALHLIHSFTLLFGSSLLLGLAQASACVFSNFV